MNNRKRSRREQRRGKFSSCKYCYNTPQRHQGLCGVCAGRTKEENKLRYQILLGYETLTSFLEQSNISKNNIKTIQSLLDANQCSPAVNGTAASEPFALLDGDLAVAKSAFFDFATVVLEVGQSSPRKKRRIKRIKEARPELYERMKQQPYLDWYFDEYEECDFGDESE